MPNLIKVRDHYYYNKRIPPIFSSYDPRACIRLSLKTRHKKVALGRALVLNARIESYWRMLAANNTTYDEVSFKAIIKETRLFPDKKVSPAPKPDKKLKDLTVSDLREILFQVLSETNNRNSSSEPETGSIKIKAALEMYWKLSNDITIHKSERQVEKWKGPRLRAVNNFIKVCSNKQIKEITRDNLIRLRDWWMKRIKKGVNPATANKDFIHLKVVVERVSDHLGYKIDIQHLFRRMKFKTVQKQSRLPLPRKDIIKILDFSKHELEDWTYCVIAILAETGARPSEIFGLLPEDIHLDTDIPFLSIIDRKDRELKTRYSERDIPLVGYALEAVKDFPHGFKKYRNRVDAIGTRLNKLFRANGLFPSDKHSFYSMRHSFQDRILSINTPDRIQADLMGHKFLRPSYGDGASLEQKHFYLQKIQLRQFEL